MNNENKFAAIKKGLLEVAILRLISRRKVYAADILTVLGATEFATQEGTLYPLLSRLCLENAVAYEWVESAGGPPRKYYSLTPKGRQQLENQLGYWKKLEETISHLGGKI
jgi:PadR family transcriptional regulator PadR